jgi:HEAT repeat protein
MKTTLAWIVSACLPSAAVAAEPVSQPAHETKPVAPPDWKAFDDPAAFLLTDAFAASVSGLAAVDKEVAIQRLKGSLKAGVVEIRRRAALTLAALGDKSGVPTLIDDLSTATGRDRENVAIALRILRDERAVPALREALKDKSPRVRGFAAAALGEMKVAKAYDEIVALTKDKEGLVPAKVDRGLNCFPYCPALSACHALADLGDERAVPVLIGLLADADLRGSALRALEDLTKQKLGDDPEKWKAWWKSKP